MSKDKPGIIFLPALHESEMDDYLGDKSRDYWMEGPYMKNMSFWYTREQMYDRTKTVTRRFGWWDLKPGDEIMAVEKCMGLKKGERIIKIHAIEVTSARVEKVRDVLDQPADIIREGFRGMTTQDFYDLLLNIGKTKDGDTEVHRIEFVHI